MMQRCCCLDLRTGCVVTAIVRLLSWIVILLAAFYTCLHVFSPDNKGWFHHRARINIEENAYVMFLIILVSLFGAALEPLMIAGVIMFRPSYIRSWFIMTIFTLVFSTVLALCFLLHNFHIIRIGDNWFNDALCVLADVVFFFIPEYLFGPRLIPLLIALLIMGHILLPVLHGLSFFVVYSYYKTYICPSPAAAAAAAAAAAGHTHSSAPPLISDGDLEEGQAQALAQRQGHRLCQKCQLALEENGGLLDRCTSTPLLKPIETTC